MIIRSVTRRHGARALASALPRPCTRFISQDTTTTGLTPEALESVTTAAALNQIPQQANGTPTLSQHKKDNRAEAFKDFRRLQKLTSSLGSHVSRPYNPEDLVKDPPAPEEITLELLMASQTHMGHHTSRWNPGNARYIYGVRHGIHVISLEATAAHLRRAARVVEEVTYRGGLVLYVGTRKGQMEMVTQAAARGGGCHLFTKWTPGAITNRDVILRDREVRMVNEVDREVPGLATHVRDRRPITPDLVVCLNPLENKTLLHECALVSIPTVAIIDTDVDPSCVTLAIPANDDSLRSTALIGGILGRAGQIGKKRRLADAESGVVHWETPTDTQNFIDNEVRRFLRAQGEWARDSTAEVNAKGRTAEDRLLDNMGEMNEEDRMNIVGM
ncbi:40S ribosomal protein mrp4 [Sodiomyces alkalinus F11]|uniref:40S ribosomal protein mrp4 n=1 Tax=Sodiomyces alkalinus (strain CBS 110278 / VKM F-3762 / F11) TaxID=1314773 RepID=A0A3N2PTY5_SODAK|nr:40S ribosomal protein mrp4 [Sodiomyces alkalinus F11]ROT37967.1 40S ribosomal protein mrp4 [Sodiomyces alkalinus F11]